MSIEADISYERAVRLDRVAHVWAEVDGCEGADFLIGLAQLLRNATGGGYAYHQSTAGLLKEALDLEIQAHKEWDMGEGLEDGIIEQETLDWALAEEAKINGSQG